MSQPTLKDSLAWRYATHNFDTTRTIAPADLDYILSVANLMPTAYGLQPFRLIVVTDQAVKEQLVPASYNQAHVAQNSAYVVVAIRTDIDVEMIREYIERIETTRGLEAGTLADFKGMMENDLLQRSPEAVAAWARNQAYLALGGLIAGASELGVDNHALEGFDADKYDEILDLKEQNLHTVVTLALGYRADESEAQAMKKVRVPIDKMVIRK